jgi:hypothetical protein
MSTSASAKSALPFKAGVSATAETESPKGNLRLFHVEGAAVAVEDASVNYQSASMIAVGADAQNVTILALLVNLFLAITCLKAPAFIERIGLTKKGAVVLALMNSFTWLPLIMAYMLFKDTLDPIWFVFLWLFNIIPGMMLSTQRDNWLSSLVPQNVMGSYLGRRMAIKSTFYLGAFFTLGLLLDNYGENAATGFTIVFFIALISTFIYFGIYCLMRETKGGTFGTGGEEVRTFGIYNFFRELKERKLSKYILFTSLFGVSVSLCGPLYSVYMLSELHFSYMLFTVVIAVEYITRIIGTPFWGHFADKYGDIRVLNIVTRVIPFLPICWLFSPNPGFLIFIQIVSGFCWGAYDLCTQNYLFKMAPAKTKLRYIIYNKSLTLFCMALGGLLSVFLLEEVFPVGGSRILSIFLISGVFRGLIVLYLVPKLVDFAVSINPGTKPMVIDDRILNTAFSKKSGMYYQPTLWERYSKKDVRRFSPEFIKEMGVAASTSGLYYQSDQWGKYVGKEKQQSGRSVLKEIKDVISTAGLYYHPEKWMKQFSGSVMMPAGVLQETGNISASQALYYNPAAWDRYVKGIAQQKPEEIKFHAVSYQTPAAVKTQAVSHRKPVEKKTQNKSVQPNLGHSSSMRPYQMQLVGI